MSRTDVSIPTPDGDAAAYVFRPETGSGPWPGAMIFMDAPAIRPAMFEMGQRLADAGYFVLLPDMFWRAGPYDPIDIRTITTDEQRREVFGKLRASTDEARATRDTGAFLDWILKQPDVKGAKVGVTGYCMGGSMALRAAGNFPDKVGAAASFHGGGMATDSENSPHLLAPRITAKVLVAGADEDRGFDEAQCERLDAALKSAGVDAEVGIWRGARHGWVPRDMPVHNPEAAERHWRELVGLFDSTLK